MKRRILIVGNTRGETGVSTDIRSYKKFFHKNDGGAWEPHEIETMLNPTRKQMLDKISNLKRENLDFFIFVFSGHGGFSRLHDTTVMELSMVGRQAQDLYESELTGIAPRQLSILDCCRSYYNEILEKPATIICNRATMLNEGVDYARIHARNVYNALVRQSCPCHIILYACSKGESANGYEGEGGVYSQALLDIDKYFSVYDGCYPVEEAHSNAKKEVMDNLTEEQTPSAKLPRCLSSQRLPWAVHAEMYTLNS